MNPATWPFDGRELTEVSMYLIPVQAKAVAHCWSYSDEPPDDSGWRLCGKTADGERLWGKVELDGQVL